MTCNNRGDILVVGDWFVDEYWFVARHHSGVSSHAKPLHYRIVSEENDVVKDLCGGGFISRVLYELREYQVDGLTNATAEITKLQERLPGLAESKRKTLRKPIADFMDQIAAHNEKRPGEDCCSLHTLSLIHISKPGDLWRRQSAAEQRR